MPPFDFSLSDDTIRLLELIKQQQEQAGQIPPTAVAGDNQQIQSAPPQSPTELTPQPQQRQAQMQPEQASGTELVNRAVEAALPQRQSYLLPQAPSVPENQYRQALLQQKALYDAAQSDAERQAIHEQAEYLRNVGNDMRMDLSGYGEGVSLKDATRNLATQQAKDVMQMVTGRYSLSSDQFYELAFDGEMANGASASTAHRRAAKRAREYKAKRMAYLNGLYNSYGTDGRVTNPLGAQVLAELANENPATANAYGNLYATPAAAYQNEQQTARQLLNEQNTFARLLETFKQQSAEADRNVARNNEMYRYQRGIDQQNKISDENRAEERNRRAEELKFDLHYKKLLSDINLYKSLVPDADISEVARAALGWKSSGGKDPESAKVLNSFYKNMMDATQAQINSLQEPYKNKPEEMPQKVQDKISELQDNLEAYASSAEVALGLKSPDTTVAFKNIFSDNQTLSVIETIWDAVDGDSSNFLKAVEETIEKSNQLSETNKGKIRSMAHTYLASKQFRRH